MNRKSKILLLIVGTALAIAPVLSFASQSVIGVQPNPGTITSYGGTLGDCNAGCAGANSATYSIFLQINGVTVDEIDFGRGGTNSPQSNTVSIPFNAGDDIEISNTSAYSGNTLSGQFALGNVPIVPPKVATSDIAIVGGTILGAFIYPSEWVLETFGPPLFVLLLVFAVFFAIYHRIKVGRWL